MAATMQAEVHRKTWSISCLRDLRSSTALCVLCAPALLLGLVVSLKYVQQSKGPNFDLVIANGMFDEQLPTDLMHSSSVTRQCLIQSLDMTAYGVISTRPPSEFLNRCLIVDQVGVLPSLTGRRTLRSQPQLGAVAIIDRTANLELAAKEILCSRTFFSSRGPYAPSCILVNEYVEDDFVRLFRKQLSTVNGHVAIEKRNDTNVVNERAPKKTSEIIPQELLVDANGVRIIKILGR
jgi:hypothetical protein